MRGEVAMDVTREDLEGLLRTLNNNLKALDQGNIEMVKWSLGEISRHLARNLGIKEAA